MHPILFRIGSLQLPTYGFFLALALLAGIYVAIRLGRREGLQTAQVVDFSTWLIITGLIGAKIYMILTGWGFYTAHPGEIFSLDTLEAGGGFYGAFIGAALFALWYVRRHRWPLAKVFDAFAPAVAIGQCIGRLGCFAAGDDYGKVARHSSLAVVFTNPYSHQMTGVPLGVPLYPVQLFESALTLIIFLILWELYRHKKRDGEIFVAYMMLYAVARFFLEFYRGDPDRGFFFNGLLSTAQVVAIVAFILGIILIFLLRRHGSWVSTPAPAVPKAKRAGERVSGS
ncbi:MAG TPA: prolipoprotein diacylglyceryl transferase [Terriglobia bacterium]|nr:prolipoprotein diacylglyceryl transferase [Terriglobia bacterium]